MTVWRPQVAEVFAPLWRPEARAARYLGAHGGRGSGKSWDRALAGVVRMATEQGFRFACVREVQKSLKDSVHQLLVDTIQRENLGSQFDITERAIANTVTGAYAIFMGMKDQNAESVKSLEGFDVAWWEEAQTASARSLELLRPTIRKPGSQIWGTWNPRFKHDPIDILLRQSRATESERVVVKANWDANAWFSKELERERLIDLEQHPTRYQHIWEGAYEKESDTQFISGAVTGIARRREFYIDASDPMILGVDVARFGDDDSVIQPRRGSDARSHEPEIISRADTMQLVGRILETAERLHADAIYVDETGLGAGVIDRLNQLTDIAVGVNFGAASDQRSRGLARGANKRAEMWIKMREALRTDLAIRDDDELEKALTGPLYTFDRNNHILLEKKDDMRKRGVKSPDRADALALTYAYPAIARALREYEESREDEEYDPIWGNVG